MEAVLIDVGADLRDLGDLVPQRFRVFCPERDSAASAVRRLDLDGVSELLWWDQGPGVAGMPGCPHRFRPEGEVGGRRLILMAGGSEDVGLDELVEFPLSRHSNSAIRLSSEAKAARMAA